MWRSPAIPYIIGRLTHLSSSRIQTPTSDLSVLSHINLWKKNTTRAITSFEGKNESLASSEFSDQKILNTQKYNPIGKHVSRKDKIHFLLNTLLELKDSKEAIYGALDAWVAWEQTFPLVSLKRALLALEKDEQWHRVVQVIKWMLSKGQGCTMGTYGQLIKALDKDHRAEEAHQVWVNKIGTDLHSIPWQLCKSMISIYYRNNMLERLVKLFKGLEAFDRKPPEKSIVQKVADAYEMLGLIEEKERVVEKYKDLFAETRKESRTKKSKKGSSKEKKKLREGIDTSSNDGPTDVVDDAR